MSRTAMKRAAGADNVPDLEDWWGDFDIDVPPPAIKRARFRVYDNPNYGKKTKDIGTRPKRKYKTYSLKERLMAYCMVALIVTLAFFQITRLAEISDRSKQIAGLNKEIKQLNETYDSNVVRLSMLQNINKVREEAISRLGMEYPTENQIRVVALPGYYSDTKANNADESGAGEISP